MATRQARNAALVACARAARVAACCLCALASMGHAQDATTPMPESSANGASVGDAPEAFSAPMPSIDRNDAQAERARIQDPSAADFDAWEPIVPRDDSKDSIEPFCDEEPAKPDLRPFDWLRHWGFHHSSTEGPFLDRGLPMEHTSWLNRPYHLDWFAGPLLSDGPVSGRVEQSNDILLGLRAGWDFDYYWGLEWRFGWSDPTLMADTTEEELSGRYFVSDIDFVYYPWGDTKVRPYMQWGLGLTQIGSVREDGMGQEATLLSMPLGVGVQFPLTHWLGARLEIVDNLAFGADGVDTMNNFAFTAGMEFRLGARPNSYWPWRSSRTIW